MTSERQVEANRRNAEHSTKPRTPEGKAAVAQNAIKHGLLAREVVMDFEDRDEFEAFQEGLLADLAPEGEAEVLLADRIVAAAWRLRRLGRLEREMLQENLENGTTFLEVPAAYPSRALARGFGGDLRNFRTYDRLQRYEAFIERGLYKALHELQRLQAARAGHPGAVPMAFDVDVTGSVAGRPGGDN